MLVKYSHSNKFGAIHFRFTKTSEKMVGMKPFYKIYPQGKIAPSVKEDARELAPYLRHGDIDELRYYSDITPFEALTASYNNAKISLTLKDPHGNIVTMFGVGWTPNPRVGRIWLLSSNYIYKIGRPFLRSCPEILNHLFIGHDVVFNHVHDHNTVSIKWLQWLGFEATQKFPEVGKEKQPFTEFCLFKNDTIRDLYLKRDWSTFLKSDELKK